MANNNVRQVAANKSALQNHKSRKKKYYFRPKTKPNKADKRLVWPLKIIPIGGLNEIGKNMTLLQYGEEILVIDCGLMFPDEEMLGIDSVIPDFSYLVEHQENVKGLIITHGHEDHIGGVPYLLQKLNVPVYGTPLALGLIKNKLEERGMWGDFRTIHAGDRIKIAHFDIECIRTTHSIADSLCFSIDTPSGRVFHTGDFKVDFTPIDGEPIDFNRLAAIGREGVDFLLADSTNAIRPGFTPSEKTVGESLGRIFRQTDSRIIIATFSSNVHRIQKIIDHAVENGKKVAVSGRSMVNVVNLATELGYIHFPEGTFVDINRISGIPDKELVIITTGSQGEPMSALARMASHDHRAVQIKQGDTVILSSTPVPGNEKSVTGVINKLIELGANVIYSDIADIHASGHACAQDLMLIHSLLRPKHFVPAHGEIRHLMAHADIAENLGMSRDKIFILENGDVLTYLPGSDKVDISKNEVSVETILVDGFGVGDVGNVVLRDRKLLSESGLIIVVAVIESETHRVVSGPDIISRGFVYVKENEALIEAGKLEATRALDRCYYNGVTDWNAMKNEVRDSLRRFIYKETGRSPIILPIFMDV